MQQLKYLQVGIYPSGFNTPPSVSSLQVVDGSSSSIFTLNCTSTGSPATTVTWTKDGQILSSSSTYTMTQELLNGVTATYSNCLEVNTGPYAVIGRYSCEVSNTLGYDRQNMTYSGITIQGGNIYTVGLDGTLSCSTDLSVTSMQWIYNLQVLNSTSSSEVQLSFSPVNETIHGREYTCRSTSPYGIQESTYQITTQISPDDVAISTTSSGSPVTGQMYGITCLVTYPQGITSPVNIDWNGPDGSVSNGQGITVGATVSQATNTTSSITFSPFRTVHSGQYSCRAHIVSPSIPYSISKTSTVDIIATGIRVLNVNISANPFIPSGGRHQVGSSLALACQALGGYSPLSYSWNSTCSGLCFVVGAMSSTISRSVLHSADAGDHTCSVTDYIGHTGSDSIQISLTGATLYYGMGPIQNNSILLLPLSGSSSPLQCISASSSISIGQFILPNGNDVTNDSSLVSIGNVSDPGYLSLNLANMGSTIQGVHQCIIPDENSVLNNLYVGIYYGSFNTQPIISSLELITTSLSILTINCTSTGSPALNVVWRKDGRSVANNSSFRSFQIVRNSLSSTYDNFLEVFLSSSDLPGRYSCIVHDSLGRNSPESSIEIQGLQITGLPSPATVGDGVAVTCSYDLNFTSIEWLYNGMTVINTTNSHLNLSFNPVNDTVNNRQYTCRVYSLYSGMEFQAESIVVNVQADESSWNTSISAIGLAVAGYNFSMTCTAMLAEGLYGVPNITWYNPNGQIIYSSGDTVVQNQVNVGQVTMVTVEIDPLKTSDMGSYTCTAAFTSAALSLSVNSSATYQVQVEQDFEIPVTIHDNLGNRGSAYTAGSSVTLTCSADPRFGPFLTTWTSTCIGDCFILQQSSQSSVSTIVLHAADSGNHTCTVTDDVGNTGSTSLFMRVSGVQMILMNGNTPEVLLNNSALLTDNFGQLPTIQCVSGYAVANVGQWLSPLGMDLTMAPLDAFDVTLGGQADPGHLNVSLVSGQFLTIQDQGVYGCHIPDEVGRNTSLFVGIYLPAFASNVVISSLEQTSSTVFTLNCSSSGSPPTNITWVKNTEVVMFNDTFMGSQYLRDGQRAMYDNLLSIRLPIMDIVDTYTCTIDNGISQATQATLTIEGITFSGSNNLTVGENSTILCNIDVEVQKLEWMFANTVVASSSTSQQLELVFYPVEEILHGREYVCRAVTVSGTLENTISLSVEIPLDAVTLTISRVGRPIAGNMYQLICEASLTVGIRSTPVFSWLDTSGNAITSASGITIGAPSSTSLPISFDPLQVSSNGIYTCNATLYSLALSQSLTTSTSIIIIVQNTPISVMVASELEINAAQYFVLSCIAGGGTGVYTYQWTSTCNGGCVLNTGNQASAMLVRNAARSTDSGTYTCSVSDNAGNVGSNASSIQVTGVGLYASGIGSLSNNSVLEADDGRIPQLLCLSASNLSSVGDWIAPDGRNLDAVPNDPFDVIFGGGSNPGELWISTPSTNPSLTTSHEGIYTCSIPDEYSQQQYLFVGIYLRASAPTVVSLSIYDSNSTELTLNCMTAGSPASTVILTKDSKAFYNYTLEQSLTNGATSSYDNIAVIRGTPDEITGSYACSVRNSVGQSNAETFNIQGLSIVGSSSLILGDSTTLNCTSDLPIFSIEWIYNGAVISQNPANVALLDIPLVNDSLHGRQYSCRMTSPFGVQEKNTTLSVTVPSSSLRITAYTSGSPSVGSFFSITCVLAKPATLLTSSPEIYWINSEGNRVRATLNSSVVAGTDSIDILTAEFDPLLASQNSIYTCRATIQSIAFEQPQLLSSTVAANVQLPQPAISLNVLDGRAPYYAGTSLTLRCNALVDVTVDIPYLLSFTWTRSGYVLVSGNRLMISNATQLSQYAHYSTLEITALSRIADTGTYSCRVNLLAVSASFVQGSSQTIMESINIQDPVLTVLISPLTQTILDVIPHNKFSLLCNASSSMLDVSTMKSVAWTLETQNGPSQPLFHNGLSINITDYSLDSSSSASVLSAYGVSAGFWDYMCQFSFQVLGDPPVQSTQSSEIVVKGPLAPSVPIDLFHTTQSSTDALISWLVPEISYTAEDYTIMYGWNQSFLNYSSATVTGNRDISSVNQMYSITLDELLPNTSYYYQLIAENTIGTNSSEVRAFITPLPILKAYVNSSGSFEVGGALTLTCLASRVLNGSGDVTVQWLGPDETRISSSTSVSLGPLQVSGAVSSLALQFTTLYASHAGVYRCEATYTSQSTSYTMASDYEVLVTVPPVLTSVSVVPSGRIYPGQELMLTCTHELNSNVDIPVTVVTVWRRGGQVLTSSSRVNVSTTRSIASSLYQSTLLIRLASSSLDTGVYSCQSSIGSEAYVIYERGPAGQISITVQDLPAPVITISSSGLSVAGQNSTLTCYVSTINGLVEGTLFEATWTDANGITLQTVSSQNTGSSKTIALDFAPLLLSYGGHYTCSASLTIPGISVMRTNSESFNVTIQMPAPTLDVQVSQPTPYLTGMFATMTCSISVDDSIDFLIDTLVTWERNGEDINQTSRVIPQSTRILGSNIYESTLQFNTLSSMDSGLYVCTSVVSPSANQNYTSGNMAMTSYDLVLTDPEVVVTVNPDSFTGKDIEPFNSINLVCTATKPAAVVPQVQVSWSRDGVPLDNSVPGVSVRQETINSSVVSSTLSIDSARVVDSGMYTCDASINIPDSETISTNDTANVVISGGAAPNLPIVTSTIPRSTSIAITWIVQTISYTAESYNIEYGFENNSLTASGERVNGSQNLTSLNIIYSSTLYDLQPYTLYYYRIVAENSFSTSQISVATFRTTESGPTAPPSSFIADEVNARNATLTWTAPEESGQNGIITGYTVSCSDGMRMVTSQLSVILTSLTPYLDYTCGVSASNSAGSSPEATVNFTTSIDVPENAPINLQVTGSSPSSVFVSWIEPTVPNGVITGYNLYVNYSDGSPVAMLASSSFSTNYTITGLTPYQLITVAVSATTTAGEGPLSDSASGRSTEEDLSAPLVTTFVSGDAIAGEMFTLFCRVAVSEVFVNQPEIVWLSPQGNTITTSDQVTVGIQELTGIPSRLNTYTIQFNPLMTSNAGSYQCQATVMSPYGTKRRTVSSGHNLTVTIPPPTVFVSPSIQIVYGGSYLSINCSIALDGAVDSSISVTVVWIKDSNMISNLPHRTAGSIFPIGDNTYVSQVTFNPVQLGSDDGTYACEVTVNPQDQFVQGITELLSNNLPISTTAPTLTSSITPQTSTILDVPPFNIFNLRCSSVAPESVATVKTFQWEEEGISISDNGISVLISNINISMPQSFSDLTKSGLSVGQYSYACIVTLPVPNGDNLSVRATGIVIVNGPALPIAPINIVAVRITAYSATIIWRVPVLAYTQETYNISYGLTRLSLNNSLLIPGSRVDDATANMTHEAVISNLTPNSLYYYQLQSINSRGTISSNTMNFLTIEAGPSSPPTNFQIVATSSNAIHVSWNPPPLSEQNGVITGYSLTCIPYDQDTNLTQSYSTHGMFSVSGFIPATTYNCSVFAGTSGGRGPAVYQTVTLLDDIPGPVESLSFTKISPTLLQITWSSPSVTNGVIQSYLVHVGRYDGLVFSDSVDGEQTSTLVPNLNKYTPYNVSVSARTSAGYGPTTSNITFIEEGAPSIYPRQININRINVTHMNVSWAKMTLLEAKGSPTSYNIRYEAVGSRTRRAAEFEAVDPDSSFKVISGLGYTQSYLISVSASTAAGEGPSSTPILAEAPAYSIFQLRIRGISNCLQWRTQSSLVRANKTALEISTKLMDDCHCTFTSQYITEGFFSCDSKEITHVIYRAKISSTSYTDSETLIGFIQSRVSSGTASLTLDQLQLYLDPSCVVLINSFSDPLCSFEPPTIKGTERIQAAGSINTYIIIILVVVALAMILLVAIIIAFFLYNKINQGNRSLSPVRYNLKERPIPSGHDAQLLRCRQQTVIPNLKAEEAETEDADPNKESNDYEVLDSLQANNHLPPQASNQDEADPEVKVDVTSL